MRDQVKAMHSPATAPWNLHISSADFDKLRAGFQPQRMEHKWKVWASEQTESGSISIHFARSWTDNEQWVLHIRQSTMSRRNGAKVEALTWEKHKGDIHIPEEQAKREVVFTSRMLLGCTFEALPTYNFEEVFNAPCYRRDPEEDEEPERRPVSPASQARFASLQWHIHIGDTDPTPSDN